MQILELEMQLYENLGQYQMFSDHQDIESVSVKQNSNIGQYHCWRSYSRTIGGWNVPFIYIIYTSTFWKI